MIAYAIVLLTDIEDIHKAESIDIMYGTAELSLHGEAVRRFVECTNHAYHDFPYYDCLTAGLEFVPPKLRFIFAHLYETLKETIVWDEQTAFE